MAMIIRQQTGARSQILISSLYPFVILLRPPPLGRFLRVRRINIKDVELNIIGSNVFGNTRQFRAVSEDV